MPKRVFISYRREDTAPAAGPVYDRLSRLLSKSNVFFDVSTIGGGENFETAIASQVAKSDAALVFIGDKWLAPVQPAGKSRIWDPDDYVRAEVNAALTRDVLVLPVLVSGARMPKPEQVPEDIRAITTKNALPLRHESFDDDVENIVAAVLGGVEKNRSWEDKGRLWSKIIYAAIGTFSVLTLILVVALTHFLVLARPLSTSIGAPLTALMLIAGSLSGVWIGLTYERRKRGLR